MKGCAIPFEVILHISHLFSKYSNNILLNVTNILHSYVQNTSEQTVCFWLWCISQVQRMASLFM